jgi:hypothetical protein
MPEGAVRLFNEGSQFLLRYFFGRNVQRENCDREVHEGVILPFGEPVLG